MNRKKVIVIFLCILILGGFLRSYKISQIPLGSYPDEAMNGNNALENLTTHTLKVFYPENNGREGLFVNIQTIAVWFFGNHPWVLRLPSVLFGTLAIWGIYLLAKELFEDKAPGLALLASFFLATSYWHLNFSRIGFRAIMVPFLSSFGLYFLLRGLRRGTVWDLVWSGVFTGLGFYTYIAFRFILFVFAVPILWYLWNFYAKKEKRFEPWEEKITDGAGSSSQKEQGNKIGFLNCGLCSVALFLFITFLVALPIGIYFLKNPSDFFGRGGQVSIFSSAAPLKEFVKSSVLTLGMFFVRGDCNWRHNFNCYPELNPIVAFLFLPGAIEMLRQVFHRAAVPRLSLRSPKLVFDTLFGWIIFMSLPAILTREGLPHALRSLGMIIPVMIVAAFGGWLLQTEVWRWFEVQKNKWPQYEHQLRRIRREVALLFFILLLTIPLLTFHTYFFRWANHPDTYYAFATDIVHVGEFLNSLPSSTQKYAVVNMNGDEVRGIPMPAQTVMFITNTFQEKDRSLKNIRYLLPRDVSATIPSSPDRNAVIAFLNSEDLGLIRTLLGKFPSFRPKVPGDFIVLVHQ